LQFDEAEAVETTELPQEENTVTVTGYDHALM
jgi:hypothetical protein